jgi:hypothetical protein
MLNKNKNTKNTKIQNTKKNIISPIIKQTNNNNNKFFLELYSLLSNTYKESNEENEYNISYPTDIPTPKSNYITKIINDDINNNIKHSITYSFVIKNNTIKVNCMSYEYLTQKSCLKYINKIKFLFDVILQINNYSLNCSNTLNIYIYLTKFKKTLPHNTSLFVNDYTSKITKYNINTGYTTKCVKASEIIIYRKEEWFKVLLHELMHHLDLDYSGMEIENIDSNINNLLHIFPEYKTQSHEAYAEIWALLLNTSFYTFLNLSNKYDNYNKFIDNFNNNMHNEIVHSTFQVVKIMNFYNTTYSNFINNENKNIFLCDINIPPIISYFVIKLILLTHYNCFVEFCINNNLETNENENIKGNSIDKYKNQSYYLYAINFKKDNETISKLFNYIKKYYNNETLMNNLNTIDLNNYENDKLQNMRMTIHDIN